MGVCDDVKVNEGMGMCLTGLVQVSKVNGCSVLVCSDGLYSTIFHSGSTLFRAMDDF